jgi:hypothetical protein
MRVRVLSRVAQQACAGMQAAQQACAGMQAQVGPNGEPLTGGDGGPKSPRNKSGAKRRRNGRWSQEETDTLIALVRSTGKGKWKKILEEGSAAFKNRSQVCSCSSCKRKMCTQ